MEDFLAFKIAQPQKSPDKAKWLNSDFSLKFLASRLWYSAKDQEQGLLGKVPHGQTLCQELAAITKRQKS